MSESIAQGEGNPDREVIGRLRTQYPDFRDVSGRVYGIKRRSGSTANEAEEKTILEIENNLEKRRQPEARPINESRRKILSERLEYPEVLSNPEDYLYHGSVCEASKINTDGLKGSQKDGGQELFFFIGTQEFHQNPSDDLFFSFGQGGTRCRIKKEDLDSLGFDMGDEYVFGGKNKAVSVSATELTIPSEMIETWDDDVRMWLPIVGFYPEDDTKPIG